MYFSSREFNRGIIQMLLIIIALSALGGIALWELGWWLAEHVSIDLELK